MREEKHRSINTIEAELNMKEGMTFHYNTITRKKTFDGAALITSHYYPTKPRWELQWEKYNFSQLFLVLEGECVYTTEHGSYHVSAGMMFYRPAYHASIYEWTTENVRFGIINLLCESEAMNTFGEEPIQLYEEELTSLLDLIKITTRICEGVTERGALGMRFKQDTPDAVIDYLSASLERFLCMLYCRMQSIPILVDESQKANKYIDESKLMEDVCAYLTEHVTEQLTIAKICAHFGISQTTLMKKFRCETGQSIMEFFTEQKIDEAKRRIRRTSQNFAEIAEDLGFSSANYFSRVFKAKEGMTPTEYSKYASKRNAAVIV